MLKLQSIHFLLLMFFFSFFQFLLIYSSIGASVLTYNDYTYPKWADDLGICMSVTCAAVVPMYALGRVVHALLTGKSLSSVRNGGIDSEMLTGAKYNGPKIKVFDVKREREILVRCKIRQNGF